MTAIRKARGIPDCNVVPCPPVNGVKLALVSSQSRELCFHEVQNWDKDNCSCTCGLSVQGNVCKHQIKCLLTLGGHTEVQLLHRLGTKWGTSCGGLEQLFSENWDAYDDIGSGSQPVADLEVPAIYVSSDSEDDDDCIILPHPDEVRSSSPIPRTLVHFQKEVGRLYAAVSHSTYLCSHSFEYLLRAVNQSLDFKASMEVQGHDRQDETVPQVFVPVVGNDRSLKRKRDLLEMLQAGRKRRENMSRVSSTDSAHLGVDDEHKL
ncbi:hypothetical protein R1sor_002636 [Riccia sorocarpa]|uniref:SWIM-type domain-containing protein n=1 Tax=Riccia sorocarpa TaxID=122646 RepID=A0ABD3H231_9MARC